MDNSFKIIGKVSAELNVIGQWISSWLATARFEYVTAIQSEFFSWVLDVELAAHCLFVSSVASFSKNKSTFI